MIVPSIALATIACGAVVGSHLATAEIRSRRAEQAIRGGSRCDGCQAALGFAETVPVISYLKRRGRCRACGGRIDPLHLVGEVAGAALATCVLALPADDLRAWIARVLCSALGLGLLSFALHDPRTLSVRDGLACLILALCAGWAVSLGLEARRWG